MNTQLAKLEKAESITEWIGQHDVRLEKATDLPATKDAVERGLRVGFNVSFDEYGALNQHVHRLLGLDDGVQVWSSQGMFDQVSASFELAKPQWLDMLPDEQSMRFTVSERFQAWGGIALCGNVAGLAVMGAEYEPDIIEVTVERVPDATFHAILNTSSLE